MITALTVLSFFTFIGLGLPDGLLGVAWPSMRAQFGQPLGAITFLLGSASLGSFLAGVNSGRVIRAVGLARTLLLAAAAMALGLAAAAVAPIWWITWPAFLLTGIGAGLIDAGFNSYAAHHFSATAMNWMHASYGIGATAGPPMVTLSLLHTHSWRPAYAAAALFLALVFVALLRARRVFTAEGAKRAERGNVTARTRSAADAGGAETRAGSGGARPGASPGRRGALVWGGVLLFFLYTGVEVSAGQLSYTLLTEGRGVDAVSAGFWVGAFWFSLTAGRVLLGPVSQRLGSRVVLRVAFIVTVTATVVLALGLHSLADGIALALLGLGVAPIFPLLVLLTPGRVGAARAHDVIGYQMAAATAGSVVLAGGGSILAGRIGIQAVAPFILLLALLAAALYTGLTVMQRSVVHSQ